jgi:hypothetical protein
MITFLGLAIFSCAGSPQRPAQGERISLSSIRLGNPQLVEILNYAVSQVLNREPPAPEQELRLKLYAVPKEGDCLPDSHYVCSRHYYLAVSSFEEGFGAVVYDLGEVGEISDIQWLKPNQQQTARLRLRVTNFPVEYFSLNDKLPKREQMYELEVALNRLTVRPLR